MGSRSVLTDLQYRLLKRIAPAASSSRDSAAYRGSSKLEVLLGREFLARLAGKTVIDFGCGAGLEAIEMVRAGAKRVIGIDIREEALEGARKRASEAGVQDACVFATATDERADIIISLDAFEHFDDPLGILKIMDGLLASAGEVLVSFGPTWLHPLGGHTFSVFPWSHLIFSESALIRWRADHKKDGARRFSEVAGGLNRMTIRRFEKTVASSPFEFAGIQTVPIRKLRSVHCRLTREFTSALVRCRLVKRRQTPHSSS